MSRSRRFAGLSWLALGALNASCNLNPHGEDPSFDNAAGAGIFPPTDPAMGAPSSAASTTSSPEMMGPTLDEPIEMPPGALPVGDPTGSPTGTPTGTATATPTEMAPPAPTTIPTATATAPSDTEEPDPPPTEVGSGGAGNGGNTDDGGVDVDPPDGGVTAASILTTDGGTDLGAEQAEATLDADGGAAGNRAF